MHRTWWALALFFLLGCRTVPPLPPVNLTETAWTVRRGQAIWKTKADAPELAGDFLIGIREDGQLFAQFTKTPFPMVVAQATTNQWQLELPMQNKRYSGKHKPPARLIWLQLPAVLAGRSPPKGWSWQGLDSKVSRLENKRTGEFVEIYVPRN